MVAAEALQERDAEIGRLRAEVARLREEHAELLENAPESVFELDENGNFTYLNKRAEERLGVQRQELIGKSFTRILVPERVLSDVRELEKVLKGKAVYGHKTAVVDKAGKHLFIEISAKPMKAGEKIVGVHGIARSVEEAPDQELYRKLFEAANEAMAVVDGVGRFESVNAEFLEEFRYSNAEVLGYNAEALGFLGPGQGQELLAKGKSGRFEARVKAKNGKDRAYRIDYSVLAGNPPALQLLFVDVNDLVEEEQGFKDTLAKLKQEEKSRQDFFNIMTHELKTPLTPIKGYLELLLEEHFGPLNRKQRESLEIISRSISLSQNLIEDLSSLSRIESGRLQLNCESMNVGEVIKNAVQEMMGFAIRKELRMEIQVGKDVPMIEADKNALMRVLTNLIHNAVKFTSEKGKIRVEAKKAGKLGQG